MELGEFIGYAITALTGGGIGSLVFWRLNKRKKVAEVKADEIENIAKTVEAVYKPMIDQLTSRVDELNKEILQLRAEREVERKQHEEQIKLINENCEKKSAQMKQQIIELATALSNKADRAPRNAQGKFTKKTER